MKSSFFSLEFTNLMIILPTDNTRMMTMEEAMPGMLDLYTQLILPGFTIK